MHVAFEIPNIILAAACDCSICRCWIHFIDGEETETTMQRNGRKGTEIRRLEREKNGMSKPKNLKTTDIIQSFSINFCCVGHVMRKACFLIVHM